MLLAAATGCGGDGGDSDPETIVVFAAASLREPLTACAKGFVAARVRLSFGGSDELAAQIRQGVEPDIYAAANVELPGRLEAEGLVEQPVRFSGNELVVAVPRNSTIRRLEDLARKGVRVAMGSASVPAGAYAREVVRQLEPRVADAITANVRSAEPDVRGVIGKLLHGAVDAGFVYATDVKATAGRLWAIPVPEALAPRIDYAAAVVKGAGSEARELVEDLRFGTCQDALLAAGFTAPTMQW